MVKGFFYLGVFYLYKISSPSGILPTCSALHAIRIYRRQRGRKGNRLNFAITPKVIGALNKLVKGNGAPYANSIKLHAVLNCPSEIC
jgi:hypothetical protein